MSAPASARPPARSVRRMFATVVLSFEALVVVFAGLVAKDLSGLTPGVAVGLFGGLALACLLAAGLQRGPVGSVVGSVLQVAVVGSGFWVGAMYPLGALFVLLWVVALRVGGRIDREKAGYAEPEAVPGPSATPSG